MRTESNLFEIMSSAADIEDIKGSGFSTKPKKYMNSAIYNTSVATCKLLKVSSEIFPKGNSPVAVRANGL
jgi:hypothetical protein